MELTSVCSFHRKFVLRSVDRSVGIICVFLSVFLCRTFAFNLDLESAATHSGESRSKFGYSVALHQDQGSKWLLVGAPRAQTRQPGVTRGGAVYRCPLESGSFCQEIPFDTKGNGIRHNGTHYRDVEDKSDQWFGASLYAAENGMIVACAPRYVYFSTKLDKREPVGHCFVARSSSTFYEEYSPCRSRVDGWPLINDQFHQQGYCQVGMSASLTSCIMAVEQGTKRVALRSPTTKEGNTCQKGKQLVIGAPGSWYWQGQVFSLNFERGRGNYEATKEGRAKDDYSYMGYSTAVGNFNDDDQEDYVVGVPRGRQLQGKVVIYDQNVTLIDTIRGEQFGSYFGYSVAVTDLDNNGLDDVIIGAPLFSDYSTDNTYETGRVYIYYQSATRRFNKRNKDVLDGHDSRSRFGLSVAAIGDIDQDGYPDIAIGAPYGGKDGRGAVYIYHGSVKGIFTDVQQAILAEDILSGIESFGWALSGGIDMDGNQYPDLLIGAQESNKAFFLKSRPIVRVTPTINIIPQNITLESQKCVLKDNSNVTCLSVYYCILYTGIGVPDSLEFELSWKLDSLKNDSSRVYYLHSENSREDSNIVKAYKEKQDCFTAFAYIVNNVRDKLTPIMVDYKFDIVEKRRSKREVPPILNQRIPTMARAEASILKECGKDNICIPDLVVHAVSSRDKYTLGDYQKIELLVMIENRGEDSYESMLNITFPPGVQFKKVENMKFVIPMFCDPSTANKSYILCDLGNPLPKQSRTNFTLVSVPSNLNGSVPELIFKFTVNSSNAENVTTTMNNMYDAVIRLEQSADLKIGGVTTPEQFIYSESDVRKYRGSVDPGPMIEHKYILSNQGPSAVKTSVIKIDWPSSDRAGRPYLQLLGSVTASRTDISCIQHNSTEFTSYAVRDTEELDINQLSSYERQRRETNPEPSNSKDKRAIEKRSSKAYDRIGCKQNEFGCTHIHCTVGFLEPNKSVTITIKSKLFSSTLIQNKIDKPIYFVSYAMAEVLSMPFEDMSVAANTYTKTMYQLDTYVNPERLLPRRDGVQAWIIGVAVSVGLLLLLLLICLLWWCGFFRRQRPQEQAFLVPHNGDYKQVPGTPIDAKYKYM